MVSLKDPDIEQDEENEVEKEIMKTPKARKTIQGTGNSSSLGESDLNLIDFIRDFKIGLGLHLDFHVNDSTYIQKHYEF